MILDLAGQRLRVNYLERSDTFVVGERNGEYGKVIKIKVTQLEGIVHISIEHDTGTLEVIGGHIAYTILYPNKKQ